MVTVLEDPVILEYEFPEDLIVGSVGVTVVRPPLYATEE
jgi:hypothetical protein